MGDMECVKKIYCYETCLTCSGRERNECLSCKLDLCLDIKKGTCEGKCPSKKFDPSKVGEIHEKSTFVFSVEKVDDVFEEEDYDAKFFVVFSEEDVFCAAPWV